MSPIRVEGTDDLQQVANALKEAGDADLQKRVSAAIRQEAKPLGEKVIRVGAERMPHRGGFASRVAGSKAGVSSSLRGRSASVTITLRNPGADLNSLDRGILRHKVFGNAGVWVSQTVPSNTFSKAFEAEAEKVQQAATKAAEQTLDEVARKA